MNVLLIALILCFLYIYVYYILTICQFTKSVKNDEMLQNFKTKITVSTLVHTSFTNFTNDAANHQFICSNNYSLSLLFLSYSVRYILYSRQKRANIPTYAR